MRAQQGRGQSGSIVLRVEGRQGDRAFGYEKKVHPLLDREAMLTVMKMPKRVPGRVKGKVSIVRVTIPIEFSFVTERTAFGGY